MKGVTIGVGPVHASMAMLASTCFQETTGLECIIIGESEFTDSGFVHPAALKSKLFDMVDDETIIYFDADFFYVGKNNLTNFDYSTSIIACNDFILEDDWPGQYMAAGDSSFHYPDNLSFTEFIPNIRNDYVKEIIEFSDVSIPCEKWINTGFFIINRGNHQSWLHESLSLYKGLVGHHEVYFEQPAMNKAMENVNSKVHFLDRSYNTLVASRKKWPSNINGLHVKLKHHGDFVDGVLQGRINSVKSVKDYFFYE